MHTIDKQTWSRRDHFEFFKSFNHPHFNMCANVDLTKFYPYLKTHDFSFTIAFIFVISHAANAITEFRLRMQGEEIIEYDMVSPSVTILLDNDLFSFCTIDYDPNFERFSDSAANQIAAVKNNPSLKNPPGRDDLLYMTAIPWVSFTSFTHPMNQHPADFIPRFAWGKYFEENGRLKIPLSVQGHHIFMDGIHMGKLYAHIEDCLNQPDLVLSR